MDENLLIEIVNNQNWNFPLSYPLILDSKKAEDKVQLYLKTTQWINQDGLCICQKPLSQDAELHHALVTRMDVVGLFDPDIIHSSYNTLLLHPNCHRKIYRAACLIYLIQIFPLEDIRQWYQGVRLQMKGRLREIIK